MKTYFIAGRSKEFESNSFKLENSSESDLGAKETAELNPSTGKLSFRKVIIFLSISELIELMFEK